MLAAHHMACMPASDTGQVMQALQTGAWPVEAGSSPPAPPAVLRLLAASAAGQAPRVLPAAVAVCGAVNVKIAYAFLL